MNDDFSSQINNDLLTNNNFNKFSNDFQIELIRALYNDNNFFIQINDILDIEYFTNEICKWFYSLFNEHYKKYRCLPSYTDIGIIINENSSDEIKLLLQRELSNIEKVKNKNYSYIKDRSLQFCKSQNLKKSIVESYSLIEKPNSEDKIRKLLNDSLNAGQSKDIGHEFFESISARYTGKKRNPIPTGWPILNKYLNKGPASGDEILIISPTGIGKSHILVDVGYSALKQGFNVAHYSLELFDISIGKRYDSRITNISINDLDNKYEEVVKKINEFKEKSGKLFIKQYPPKYASVLTIKSHIDKLISRNFKPDIILVDYLDLLKPVNHYDQRRYELETTMEDLRALGQEYNCPIWVPTQTNRAGLDKEIITLEEIAEAFSKAFIADVVLTYSRPNDGSGTNVAGNLYLAKNRLGPDNIVFPAFIDTETSTFKLAAPKKITTEEAEKINDDFHNENIKKAYEEFKKKNGK